MLPLRRPEMDMSIKTVILVFLIICTHCVSGVPQPEKLVVNILDGEVIAVWERPTKAPVNSKFNVQMGNYSGEWAVVTSCTGIPHTYCDLSSHIHNYRSGYKVKVQLETGDHLQSAWTSKKFLPSSSKLQPPSFTLWATSSTLTVYVHQKPILRKLFPFGPVYTIYLEEIGQDKNITAYLTDDVQENERAKTFSSLRWGKEYCVSVMAEGKGGLESSSMSPKQCLKLPEQEWYIIAVSSLSVLSVLAAIVIIAAILQCYLRSPEKTPTVLKSPVSGWVPFPVSEGPMEVVTDKGWFMFGYKTEVENCAQVTHLTVEKDNEEEDRRTSMDSGVGMGSGSVTDGGKSPPSRQEDSGCGSLGGPESSTSSQSDYPLQKDMTDADITRKREDSGLGLGCQLHSSSLNLDSESLKKAVSRGNYHSQSPSMVRTQNVVVDDDEAFKQMLPEPILAEVVTGYRAGPQTCICSGAGQCSWCHKQGLYGGEVIKQYKTMSIDNGLLNSKSDFVDTYKGGLTFPGYAKTLQRDSIAMDGSGSTFVHLGETFPLLTSLAPLPLVEGGRDFSMSDVHLSLCDVQLTSD